MEKCRKKQRKRRPKEKGKKPKKFVKCLIRSTVEHALNIFTFIIHAVKTILSIFDVLISTLVLCWSHKGQRHKDVEPLHATMKTNDFNCSQIIYIRLVWIVYCIFFMMVFTIVNPCWKHNRCRFPNQTVWPFMPNSGPFTAINC